MDEQVSRKSRRIKIICGFIMFFSIFFQKLYWDDGFVPVWEIMFRFVDGMAEQVRVDWLIYILALTPAVLTNLLYLIRSIWLLNGKCPRYFTFLPGLGIAAYALSMQPFMMINVFIVIFDYMECRWIEERDAINAAYEKQKENDRAEKVRIKKVRNFPGKYPEEFYRVIRRQYRYSKKSQYILAAGCFLTAACAYIMLTVYSFITQAHGMEHFLSTNGLVQIFRQTGVFVAVFTVLMMTMIITYYIREQKRANRLFAILGMRSRTAYLMFAVAFGLNVFVGGILGIACGGAVSYVLREILQSSLWRIGSEITLVSAVSLKTIGIGFLSYLLLAAVSLGLNQEQVMGLVRTSDTNAEIKKESRIRKRPIILIGFGCVLYFVAVLLYLNRSWAETMFIHGFSILGILLLLMGSLAWYLKRLEKKREEYNRKIILSRPFYYRYWKSLWNLFYLSVVHFFVLAVFGVSFAGACLKQDVKEMYPYEIVCTAYETEIAEIQKLLQEHGAKETLYPMFRMTSVYGSDKLAAWGGSRPVQWPQGQHIAISESSYRALKKMVDKEPIELDLSGNEMHVVYQQDLSVKAHTIDWDTSRIDKRLRIGQPLVYYNTSDIDAVFPVWQIKSEERDVLTGAFWQGMQENLIVFDDDYFQEQYERIRAYNASHWEMRQEAAFSEWRSYSAENPGNMTEGPTQLICMKVPVDAYDSLLAELKVLEEGNTFDLMWDDEVQPFYGSREMTVNTQTEIFFRGLVYLFILLLLMVMGLFQYYVKFESESEEINWQNLFLKRLGMKEEDRKRAFTGQMKLFAGLPLVIGAAGGMIFTVLTAKARLYRQSENLQFAFAAAVVYLIYVGIWCLWYLWVKKKIWRQTEWER